MHVFQKVYKQRNITSSKALHFYVHINEQSIFIFKKKTTKKIAVHCMAIRFATFCNLKSMNIQFRF